MGYNGLISVQFLRVSSDNFLSIAVAASVNIRCTHVISIRRLLVVGDDVSILLRSQLHQFVLIVDIRLHSFHYIRRFADAYM